MLPEPFNGEPESSWGDWSTHFDNVADVNEWSAEQKLQWLKVRLTGRAQKAFQRPPETARASFERSRAAVKERFEPETRKARHQALFQTRKKKSGDGWADFAVHLQSLEDKAYHDLPTEAREQLAINTYLQQLSHPQVAFSVKQRRPMTLDEVVAATLEMESYVSGPDRTGITTVEVEDETAAVAAVNPIDKLMRMVEHLAEKVETLQSEVARARRQRETTRVDRDAPRGRGRGRFLGEWWTCHWRAHILRNCQLNRAQQGN